MDNNFESAWGFTTGASLEVISTTAAPSLVPNLAPSPFPSLVPSTFVVPTAFNETSNATSTVEISNTELLVSSLRLYGGILLVGFPLYCLLRIHLPRHFAVRQWAECIKTPLAASQFGYVAWIWKVYGFSDDELVEEIGLDAVCLLRILNLGFRLAVLGCADSIWLFPTYATAPTEACETDFNATATDDCEDDALNFASINVLQDGSKRFLATVLGTYVFFGYFAWQLLRKEFPWFIQQRHQWLQKSNARNYTVFVKNIPKAMRSAPALKQHFELLYGSVLQAYMVLHIADLTATYEKRKRTVDLLEHALAQLALDDKRPTHMIYIPDIEEVDSIAYYTLQLDTLNHDIADRLDDINKRNRPKMIKSDTCSLYHSGGSSRRWGGSRALLGEDELGNSSHNSSSKSLFRRRNAVKEDDSRKTDSMRSSRRWSVSRSELLGMERASVLGMSDHNHMSSSRNLLRRRNAPKTEGKSSRTLLRPSRRNILQEDAPKAEFPRQKSMMSVPHCAKEEQEDHDGSGSTSDRPFIQKNVNWTLENNYESGSQEEENYSTPMPSFYSSDNNSSKEEEEEKKEDSPLMQRNVNWTMANCDSAIQEEEDNSNNQRNMMSFSNSDEEELENSDVYRNLRLPNSTSKEEEDQDDDDSANTPPYDRKSMVQVMMSRPSKIIPEKVKDSSRKIKAKTMDSSKKIRRKTLDSSKMIKENIQKQASNYRRHLDDALDIDISDKAQGLAATLVKGLAEEGKPDDAAFVTFTSLVATHAALQMSQHHEPFILETQVAPDIPEFIFWSNVGADREAIHTGSLLSLAGTAGICLFWTIPVTFIVNLTNVQELKKMIGDFDPSDAVVFLLSNLSPILLLLLNTGLLPIVLKAVSRLEFPPSDSQLEASAFWKMCAFHIIQTFFVSMVSGSIVQELENITTDPQDAIMFFAEALPEQSAYFMQLLMVSTTMGALLELFRAVPLFQAFVRSLLGWKLTKKERDQNIGMFKPLCLVDKFYFSRAQSRFCLYFLVMFTYNSISPLVNWFCLLFFLFLGSVYRHQFIFNYPSTPDTGGEIWLYMISVLLGIMIIAEIVLAGYLILKRAFMSLAVLVPLIILSILFITFLNQQHFKIGHYLPARAALRKDLENDEAELGNSDFKDQYKNPALLQRHLEPDWDSGKDEVLKRQGISASIILSRQESVDLESPFSTDSNETNKAKSQGKAKLNDDTSRTLGINDSIDKDSEDQCATKEEASVRASITKLYRGTF